MTYEVRNYLKNPVRLDEDDSSDIEKARFLA